MKKQFYIYLITGIFLSNFLCTDCFGVNFGEFPYFFSAVTEDNAKPSYSMRFPLGSILFKPDQLVFNIVRKKQYIDSEYPSNRFIGSESFESETIGLQFAGSSNKVQLNGKERMSASSNFLIGKKESWRANSPNYSELLYENLYEGINLRYYVLNNKIKYDFILEPGADISQIQMHYSGIKNLSVNPEGSLTIRTKLTSITDYIPESYQVINGKKIIVPVKIILTDKHTSGFEATYDKRFPLIIDPALIYSTFLGGSNDDYEYVGGIDRDAAGNIFLTGRTFSSNFPTTAGSFQTGFGGYYDCFIFKLDPTGSNLIYSTFIGGTGSDAGYSLKVEQPTGNVWVVGTTDDATFPTTTGAFQTTLGGTTGLTDAFVLKLDATGANILYASLLGLGYSDYGHGIDVDASGNVYITGESNGAAYTTPGAYQSAYGGGTWDGWVAKFDPTLSNVIYATMFGGPQEDVPLTIKVAPNNEAIIAGWIVGGGMPVVAGSYDVTYNGGTRDAMVARLNLNGTAFIYATYLGGTGNDMIWNALTVDNLGNAIVAGMASSGFPTSPGAFQTTYGGGAQDVFITSLNIPGNALINSTFLGGPGDDEAYGLYSSSTGNHYVTGFCGNNFPITVCTLDSTFNGNLDGFVSILNDSLDQLLFSTYLGGSNNDKGYNIIASGNNVYVSGVTNSANFPTTIGVVDNSFNGNLDLFVSKIDLSNANLIADFNTVVGNCPGTPIQLTNNTAGAISYFWDFGDGNTDTTQSPNHTYTSQGTYDITLIAYNSCGFSDTTIKQISINSNIVAAFSFSVGCDSNATFSNLSIGGTNSYWDFGDGTFSTTINPVHNYSSGSYQVGLITNDSSGCADTTLLMVTIPKHPTAQFNAALTACSELTAFNNNSINATNYIWNFGDGTAGNNSNPNHIYSVAGTYTISLIASSLNGCTDTTTQNIVIDPVPVANFNATTNCNMEVLLNNISTNALNQQWDLGDGNTSNGNIANYIYANEGNYHVTLLVSDAIGCTDTASEDINILSRIPATFSYSFDTCSHDVNFTSLNISQNQLWYFGDGKFSASIYSHKYKKIGQYKVTLITNPGSTCEDSTTQILEVPEVPEDYLYIPNCFTPNNDGINDVFKIYGTEFCNGFELFVFDRWGEVIFESNELENFWDGRYHGNLVQSEVYAFILKRGDEIYKGRVTVLY